MYVYKMGMIVKDARGTIIEVETVINAGEGYISLKGVRLTKDLTADRRKWSKRESILHSPNSPCEVIM